jgi:two-component system response regulator HupR/HoxA
MRRLACVCSDGQPIDTGMLSDHILLDPEEAPDEGAPSSLRLQDNVDHLERNLIRTALRRTAGGRAAAARLLGVSRNGLAIKMERLQIEMPE